MNLSNTTFGTSGRKCLIIGGQHGDERSGIDIAEGVIRQLKLRTVLKQIVVIPCANESGFKNNSRAMKGKDLNRLYENKNHPAVLTANLIKQIAEDSAVVIDIHSTDKKLMKTDMPIVISRHEAYLDCFSGIRYWIKPPEGSLRSFCEKKKIPFILFEAIEGDPKSVETGIDDIINFLSCEKFI